MLKDLIKKLRSDKKNKYLYRSGSDFGDSYGGLSAYAVEVSSDGQKKLDERIEKKPVDVWQEVIGETPAINLNDLDAQIKLVKRRKEVLEEWGGLSGAGQEEEAIRYLQARKKLLKHKDAFVWPVTTESKIKDLIKKYKLSVVGFASYYRNVPMEAIDEIEKFGKAFELVAEGMPELKLIMDESPERDAEGNVKTNVSRERKKDPILLAASPFGKWFYILGAWDKEVEIVDDLIYKGK